MSRQWSWALAGTVAVLTSIAAITRTDAYIGAAATSVAAIFGALALAHKLTERDTLTGTLGRAAFLRRTHVALEKSRRQGRAIAVASLDIERFGTINSLHGRVVGDAVLREVAVRIVKACPANSLVARVHGDEFVVVFIGKSEEEVSRECVRLCVSLRAALVAPVRTQNAIVDVRIRIGADIRCGPQETGFSAEDLVMNSTLARRQQFNPCLALGVGYTPFDQEMAELSTRRAWIECEIPQALRDGEISLAYQPIVDARTMRVVKCEALLRWTSGKNGVVGPEEFIPIAEMSGQMNELGWFVIHAVCDQIAKWRDEDETEWVISVNVSPSQLRNPLFSEEFLRVMAKNSVPARLVEVEITEGVILDDNPVIRMNLGVLRCAGINVFLDDFGTGFSSLSRLASLSIQGLKIDKSFVYALRADNENDRERLLVKSICALAAEAGVTVVAEGVDSAVKAAELQQYGVHLMQGFLYSQAVPPEHLNAVARALPSFSVGLETTSLFYASGSMRLQ